MTHSRGWSRASDPGARVKAERSSRSEVEAGGQGGRQPPEDERRSPQGATGLDCSEGAESALTQGLRPPGATCR